MQATTDIKKYTTTIDYSSDKRLIKKFILFFTENGNLKYQNQLENLKASFFIDLADLNIYDDSGLMRRFIDNAYTYTNLSAEAIDEILEEKDLLNTTDPFLHHRITRFKEKFPNKKLADVFPRLLLRDFMMHTTISNGHVYAIRSIRAEHIGKLITIRGIITRVSMVKPCMRVATYVCESCGSEIYQQIFSDAFDMLEECNSEKCKIRNIKGTLTLLTRGSKFQKYQSVYVQELTSDVPQGSIPRTMKVECYGDNTGKVNPGESVVFDGIFMPKPYYGIKRMKAGLLNDTFLKCTFIKSTGQLGGNQEDNDTGSPVAEMFNNLLETTPGSDEMKNCLDKQLSFSNYQCANDFLVELFAPEIFGMKNVKNVLLTMLVGGPTLVKKDGLSIRGDINVLLMGDPGIAKSQLLKTAIKLSRRGVYTTGRGCSGVGLTASVVKDPVTGEVVLEGGALVLSDMGVCCIDELDKMSEVDRTAIHEVMEQQRVSISKAGINTSLNARCSVLGAANPIRGRYNEKKSISQNIGLPVSLISRFDVICILRDDPDETVDGAMASHITGMHFGDEEESTISYKTFRRYIEYARQINPRLGKEHHEKLVEAYVAARQEATATPRYLLSLIRLALANARLNLREEVGNEDVERAISTLQSMNVSSKSTLNTAHKIYNYILSLAVETSDGKKISLKKLFENAPFSHSDIENVITDFESTGIWMRNNEEIILFN